MARQPTFTVHISLTVSLKNVYSDLAERLLHGFRIICHLSRLLATFRKVVSLPLSQLVSCHDVFSIDALVLTLEPAPAGSARMTCTDLCTALLPPQAPLSIETMAMTERGMTLAVAVTTSQAHCPTCTQPSTPMHSDYRRTLADLPSATIPE